MVELLEELETDQDQDEKRNIPEGFAYNRGRSPINVIVTCKSDLSMLACLTCKITLTYR